jgi:hypothetical protein
VWALPGANAGTNMPPDGLIQMEAKSGERLFLARLSLVSVEIIPVSDDGSSAMSRSPTTPC